MTHSDPITVLVVDDQSMIRAGIRGILSTEQSIVVAGEAQDGAAGLQMSKALLPRVVLMDLRMPIMDGVSTVRAIRADPGLDAVRVLILTTFDGDPEALEAIRAGADGFLGKGAEPAELISAVQAIAAGDMRLSATATRAVVREALNPAPQESDPDLLQRFAPLTPREVDIVRAAAQGLDNDQIGSRLAISPFTVKTHLARAMSKLDVRTRAQLVSLAYRSGLMHT